MTEPSLQYIVWTVVPIEIVPEKHELAASGVVPPGDVIGKRPTDSVVCSQRMRNRMYVRAPLAKHSRKKIGVLATALL